MLALPLLLPVAVQPAAAQSLIDMGMSLTLPDQGYPNPWTPAALYVGVVGQGTVMIGSGAQVATSEFSVLGRSSEGHGFVTVSGANSSWNIQGPSVALMIGDYGSGTLRIENGGSVTGDGQITLGNDKDAQGTVIVTGLGSRWDNGNAVIIGESGSGTLEISDRAVANSRIAVVGYSKGSHGTAKVTGSGSVWNTILFSVGGNGGTGSLTVEAGGQVNSQDFWIDGASGTTVEIQGTGSKLSSTGSFIVGYEMNTGSLTVTDGGAVEVANGAGSISVARDQHTTGTLNIGAPADAPAASPGTINAAEIRFGAGTGAINFNHTDSNYSFAPAIAGNGSINVLAGTTLLTGNNSYSGGTIITGGTLRAGSAAALPANTPYTINGGMLDLNGYGLVMGSLAGTGGSIDLGTADLRIDQSSSSTYSGSITGAGTFTKSGSGSLVLTGANTYVGTTIVAGGTTAAPSELIVSGATAMLGRPTEDMKVGALAGDVSALHILNGARVRAQDSFISDRFGSEGSVLVSDPGSTWSHDNYLYVGWAGNGVLDIRNGAKVTNRKAYLGLGDGSSGTVTVSGPNSEWINSSDLTIGNLHRGNLTVADGGSVSAATTLLGYHVNGSGRLILDGSDRARGKLTTGQVSKGSGSGTLAFNGGILRASGNQVAFLAGFDDDDVTIEAGGAFIDSNGHNIGTSTVLNGGGGLTKLGFGTLALAGANTYTGTTTVAVGTLAVDGSLASANIQVQTGATLTGSGTLAGGVTVQNGGILAGTSGQTLTMGSLSLASGATLDATLTAGNTDPLFDIPGNLTLSGKLVINEASDLTGATRFTLLEHSGTLTKAPLALMSAPVGYKLANFALDSSGGRVTLTLKDAAGQQFWRGGTGRWTSMGWSNPDASLTAAWAGDTAIFQGRGGAVTVEGAQAFSALRFESNGYSLASGSTGALVLTDDGDSSTHEGVRVESGITATIAAPISGTATLVKGGAGTLNLTGTSTLAGPTVVEAGRLAVNGSLAGSTVTVSGGSLGGNGVVGGIVARNGGMVAPGNSIGSLNVAGNVRFEADSVYQVETNAAGQSDLVKATGAATLSGGTVQVLAESGSYKPSTSYTVLTAEGGVVGTFAGVRSNFAYLDPTLTYGNSDVRLTLTRKTVPTGSLTLNAVAVSGNQYRVADAVEALGSGHRVFDAVIGQSVDGARQAFDALSGEVHASAAGAALSGTLRTQDMLLNRMRSIQAPVAGPVQAAYAADRPGVAPLVDGLTIPSLDPRRFTLWGEGFGSWGKVGTNGNAAGMDTSTGGFAIGAESRLDETFTLGMAGGFSRTAFDVDGRLSSGANETVFGAVSGTAKWDALSLRLGALYAHHDLDTQRTITFPGFAEQASASYDGSTLMAFGEVGYAFDLGRVTVEPFVGASLMRLRLDGFTEEGGAAALTGYARSYNLGTTTLGVRAQARISAELPLTLRGMIGWRHALGDIEPAALLAFSGGTTGFSVAGLPIDRTAFVAETGLDWQINRDMTLAVSYSGQIGARAQEHAVKGNFTWRFETR
ncbi:autotransporter domain-containing protein [Microvirga roseola]|uniref:autotransporter domain-containing protein n=1 Tax=Microvirga roseola TaxID=2883126 RepID=UPI001E403AD8|nr:autotransporter domain-containing protein [Microvirga roseola]